MNTITKGSLTALQQFPYGSEMQNADCGDFREEQEMKKLSRDTEFSEKVWCEGLGVC